MNIFSLFLQLISGAFGGPIAGSAFPSCDLRVKKNAIVSLIDGALSGHFLQRLPVRDYNASDIQIFARNVVGAMGGSLLVLVVRFTRKIVERRH